MMSLEYEIRKLENEKLELKTEEGQLGAKRDQAEDKYYTLSANYQALITENNTILNDLCNTLILKRQTINNNTIIKKEIMSNKQRQEQLKSIINLIQSEVNTLIRQNDILQINIRELEAEIECSPRTVQPFTISSNKNDISGTSYKFIDSSIDDSFGFDNNSDIEMIKWYEDANLLINSNCSIDISTKSASIKLMLENKSSIGNLSIKSFESSNTLCMQLFIRIGIEILVKGLPKEIKKGEKEYCELTVTLKSISKECNCNLVYMFDDKKINCLLRIPINTLTFAKPLSGGIEEFGKHLLELEGKSSGEGFELNTQRANSAAQIREVLSLTGSIKVYPVDDNKGRVRAATQYEEIIALVQIDVAMTNPIQCFMMIYCADEIFKAIVSDTMLNMFSSDS